MTDGEKANAFFWGYLTGMAVVIGCYIFGVCLGTLMKGG